MSDVAEPYIETYTGNRFFFKDPNAIFVEPADIAVSLSRICRFNGHCLNFYSVAQHSLLVAEIVRIRKGMDSVPALPSKVHLLQMALLHDAHEAYMCDLSLPLKWALPKEFMDAWRAKEHAIQCAILKKLNLAPANQYEEIEVKAADECALYIEAWKVMRTGGRNWDRYRDVAGEVLNLLRNSSIRELVEPMDEDCARERFCDRLAELPIGQ